MREIDDVEARVQELVETISTKSAAFDVSERSKQAASEPEVQAEARVAVLEAEIRFRDDHAVRRGRELELAYDSINRMAAAIQGFRNDRSSELRDIIVAATVGAASPIGRELGRSFGGDRSGWSPNGFFIDRRTEIFCNGAVDALVVRSEVGEKKDRG